ncbi:MAG: hypothetical protein JXJ20_13480 [Anaerolineae bacterium]|nr:hypothetical protein [Anaerolineae bacterium]
MKRLFVLALVTVTALALIPTASAQDSGYVVFTTGTWVGECGKTFLGFGIVEFTANIYAPTGSWEEGYHEMINDPLIGDVRNDWTWPGFHKVDQETWRMGVPENGSIAHVRELYAEGGGYVASVEIYASCVTGEIIVYNNSIYGVHMPDPAERVQAKVLFDVNVHSEPNPDLAIPGAVLLAGQDWFVVSSVVGTDGNLWYEVFVGGAHNGFVPAAAMSLPAPLPG